MHYAGMVAQMHKQMRPAGLSAGGAFLCAEAWQSGLLQRAYPSPDLWASKPLAGSRQFESDRFHHQFSGTDGAGTLSIPSHHTGIWPRSDNQPRIYALEGVFSRVAEGP